jgi:hypothetical protein
MYPKNLSERPWTWSGLMTKYYPDGAVITDGGRSARPSPTMLDLIAHCNARQKLLLELSLRELARRRAEDDAETAVNAFVAVCVLVLIAISLVFAL